MTTYETVLKGCTPEPLMNYLKALGILRLVAEQRDPNAQGCWREGTFVLRSVLDEQALVGFFSDDYRPSPVFAPWNGDSGFLTDVGTSFETINRIRELPNTRGDILKTTVNQIDQVDILKRFKEVREKEKYLRKDKVILKKQKKKFPEDKAEALREAAKVVKEIKNTILGNVRNSFPDEVVQWIDACLSLTADGFLSAPLLGVGGLDGRLEFSTNFLSNVLDFFDLASRERCSWIENALYASDGMRLIPTSIGQFAPGRIGGPNGTQGFEGSSSVNPLDFILMIEGAMLFTGSVSRKLCSGSASKSLFPFTVYSAAVGCSMGGLKDSKEARGEVWLPLWSRFARIEEISQILKEGRAELGGKQASSSVDVARSIASLGVDRGIQSFVRFGFLKRNGKAFLATPLGSFNVHARSETGLLLEIDPWLNRFRRASADENAPPRFGSALRRIESAIFDYCQYGGARRFSEILCSLGQAERELSAGEKFRNEKGIRPIGNLSPEWLHAVSDNSPEFEMALALSGIYDPEFKVGSLRSNLEPVGVERRGGAFVNWAEKDRAVVWKSTNLITNMVAVLERRILDGKRKGCERLPLAFRSSASLEAISRFLSGDTDDGRIEELLWGLTLVKQPSIGPSSRHLPAQAVDPLPRSFALLKLLLLPGPIRSPAGPVSVRMEPRVFPLLRAGRLDEACAIASRRLRASGLVPMTAEREGFRKTMSERTWGDADPLRLAAALLIPVSEGDVTALGRLVLRPTAISKTTAV